ncbi:MAG: preprotein translocase subunit SecG, partial [Candidatus Krumholzibacteriota bacterium]|nr:preprotein translocase subunit SecG [Candidatus Krumholzibacteriota bacterium]
MWWILMVIYVPACIGLIVIVLLQKGKGAGFAGSFGAGAGPGSETVFGPRAGQTLPVKLTYIAAVVFISISVIFSMVASKVGKGTAPELLEDGGTTIGVTTELDELGIGTGHAGDATPSESSTAPSGSDAGADGDV